MNKCTYFVLFLCIALAACDSVIQPTHYNKAEELCKNNGGVDIIVVKTNSLSIWCKDGINILIRKDIK